MLGKIVKGIAGFYYVNSAEDIVYECKAKGAFRNSHITPLVGDNVEIEVIDSEKKTGNILKLLPRRSELIRPACANVDQALVVFAAAQPEPNFNLLDRFLIMMKKQGVGSCICFNKTDIAEPEVISRVFADYERCGVKVMFSSVLMEEGINEIKEVLRNKTTILAGPSGVGKSSMMNLLAPDANMETGGLSKKIMRGKQTTRHTELIEIEKDTYLCDSPGFASIYLSDIDYRDLKNYFEDFTPFTQDCRFLTCNHINEPECGVKNALNEGKISKIRYENYCLLFNELKNKAQRW